MVNRDPIAHSRIELKLAPAVGLPAALCVMKTAISFFVGSVALALVPASAFGQRAGLHAYDTPSYFEFEESPIVVREPNSGSVEVTITVLRTGDFRAPASVDFSLESGSAEAGIDFEEAAGTLWFAAGRGLQSFNVVVRADEEAEPTEAFSVVLSNPSVNGVIVGDRASISIEGASGELARRQPPRLSVAADGEGNLVLSWPKTEAAWVLEKSAASAGAGWAALPDEPDMDGDRCVVKEPLSAPRGFYRLRSASAEGGSVTSFSTATTAAD